MFNKTALIVLLISFLLACAPTHQPLQNKLLTGDIPQFDGEITDITVPIQPMYKPAMMNINISIAEIRSNAENASSANEANYVEMIGKDNIERSGDMLVSEIEINKMIINGKTLAPKRSILKFRILMDSFGKMHEMEASSPAFAERLDKKKLDEFITSNNKTPEYFYSTLPKNTVKTGDVIKKFDMKAFLQQLNNASQEEIKIDGEIEYIIKGWSFFDNRKVLVVSVDDVLSIASDIQFKLNGYELYDAETFQIVESYQLVVMTVDSPNGKNSYRKKLEHISSKILN